MTDYSASEHARRVTLAGLVVNLLLTTLKILAGIFGKSGAMLADGLHSLSDLVTDFIVLFSIKVAGKERDQTHHYGHGKYETFATMIISFALAAVAVGILNSGFRSVMDALRGIQPPKPGVVALVAALVSIAVKELLYRFTLKAGKRIQSPVLIANAWHHRSDALSSMGTSAGIAGAVFLGESWRILDPLAGMVISVFIFRIAWQLGLPSVRQLLEAAPPAHVREELESIISGVHGVRHFHNIRSRYVGNSLAVEVHIKVDKSLTVEASHDIASTVEQSLRARFGQDTHVGVHVEPYTSETAKGQ
jgi:cation diffusion facilitator family transporter